jgi:hypothetical protein
MAHEHTTAVRPIKVSLICDCGGQITFVPFGKAQPTSPPKYEHECDKCKQRSWQPCSYPEIRFETVN